MNAYARRFALWLYFIATLLTVIAFFGLVIAEAYVRWKINQDFSFLEGGVLPVALLLIGEFLGFAYFLRDR